MLSYANLLQVVASYLTKDESVIKKQNYCLNKFSSRCLWVVKMGVTVFWVQCCVCIQCAIVSPSACVRLTRAWLYWSQRSHFAGWRVFPMTPCGTADVFDVFREREVSQHHTLHCGRQTLYTVIHVSASEVIKCFLPLSVEQLRDDLHSLGHAWQVSLVSTD